jgi:hypothetical protein
VLSLDPRSALIISRKDSIRSALDMVGLRPAKIGAIRYRLMKRREPTARLCRFWLVKGTWSWNTSLPFF